MIVVDEDPLMSYQHFSEFYKDIYRYLWYSRAYRNISVVSNVGFVSCIAMKTTFNELPKHCNVSIKLKGEM
jgi:hypothetical protein